MSSGGNNWPVPGEYANMLQSPPMAFRDSDLQGCTIERDPNTRQPIPRAGAFATVYKGTCADGRDIAIRVFTSASGTDQRDRYAAISSYVNSLNGSRPSSLVDFRYFEKGIRVASKGGKWFPLLTMEWVPGDTLFDWVRGKCRSSDAREMEEAAEKWVELVRELNEVEIAHGDLQHGNVMVTPAGKLQLVDYDCMCVPDLVGQPNLEIGVEPYQHQERDETTLLYPGLDNFSALFILVALRALAKNPQLWFEFNEPPHGEPYDKLLFRREDFDSPDSSRLYSELKRLPDQKLERWTESLFELWRVPMKEVPPLAQIASDIDTVRSLLSQNAFDDALKLLNPQNAPQEIRSDLQSAKERVRCREQLEKAVANGDEAEMIRLYNPDLLDDYPLAAEAVAHARKASDVLPVLEQLRQAKQREKWREFVRIWDRHRDLLEGRRSSDEFARDVRQWRDRNATCDIVLQLLNDPHSDVAALRDAWVRLKQIGGHPEADQHESTVRHLIARHDALEKLQKVPTGITLQNDQNLVEAWDEKLFSGWKEAQAYYPRVEAAKQRLDRWGSVRATVDQHGKSVSRAGEQALAQAATEIDDGYDPSLQPRLEEAKQRLEAVQRLEALCSISPVSESEVTSAWGTVQKLGAEALLDTATRQRAVQASQLDPLLQQLKALPPHAPPNPASDQQLLSLWNDTLRDCPEAAPWLDRYEEACRRRDLLQRLNGAIDSGNDEIIVECCESPLLDKWPFSSEQSAKIAQARKAIEGARGLIRVLEGGHREQLLDVFDYRIIQEFPGRIAPFMTQLREWLPVEILPQNRIGLSMPTLGPSAAIQKSPGNSGWALQWTWPERRFTNQCKIIVTRSTPDKHVHPDSVKRVMHTQTVTRKAYEDGGGRVALRSLSASSDWNRCLVLVWACVTICGETFYSEPLKLGRLR